MSHITQNDIAKILNVSRITVSKALRDTPDISLEMKNKVKKVVKELGYIPHIHARNLHLKKTFTIGVVVPDVANSFFSFAIHGIMDAAAKHGYHIILTVSREKSTIQRENIMTLLSMRVDGILIAISGDTVDREIFDTVQRFKTPLVFFDRSIDGLGFSSVGIDDRLTAATLVEYVIGCGYKKIAHIAGSSKIAIGKNRCLGYLDVMEKYNIPVRQDWIIEGGFDKISGYTGFKRLKESDELPEVIFAANDRIAQGAYNAIREAGLRIPDDIGVVAFGHSEFAELLSPTLTITDCPPDVLGYKAMNLLANEISDPSRIKPTQILLEANLVVNKSVLSQILV